MREHLLFLCGLPYDFLAAGGTEFRILGNLFSAEGAKTRGGHIHGVPGRFFHAADGTLVFGHLALQLFNLRAQILDAGIQLVSGAVHAEADLADLFLEFVCLFVFFLFFGAQLSNLHDLVCLIGDLFRPFIDRIHKIHMYILPI